MRNTKLEKYPAVCPDQFLTYTLEYKNNEIITLSDGFFISANVRLTEIRNCASFFFSEKYIL